MGQGQPLQRDLKSCSTELDKDSLKAAFNNYLRTDNVELIEKARRLAEKNKKWLGSDNMFNQLLKISSPSTISTFSNYKFVKDGPQKRPYILDADIRVPLGLGGRKWGYTSIHIIPQFKVRIFQDDDSFSDEFGIPPDVSNPVRTPSYIPRITVFKSFDNWWSMDKGVSSKYLGLSFFHHSNGQDGPEFLPDGKINYYNGNFGEQLVFEILFGRLKKYSVKTSRFLKDKAKDEPNKPIKFLSNRTCYEMSSYQEFGLELHHPEILTNQEFKNYNLYGRTRINAELGWIFSPLFTDMVYGASWMKLNSNEPRERLRFVIESSYILDMPYALGDKSSQEKIGLFHFRRLNIVGTAYWRIPNTPSTALFIQAGYEGSDPYNIYFAQQAISFRFGLALAYFDK